MRIPVTTLLVLAIAMYASNATAFVMRKTDGNDSDDWVVYEDGTTNNSTSLDERSRPYQLGVQVFSSYCGDNSYVRDCNHDEHSCNYGYITNGFGGSWDYYKDKTDGSAKVVGCISWFSDEGCSSEPNFAPLRGEGHCIRFTNPTYPQCIVVS